MVHSNSPWRTTIGDEHRRSIGGAYLSSARTCKIVGSGKIPLANKLRDLTVAYPVALQRAFASNNNNNNRYFERPFKKHHRAPVHCQLSLNRIIQSINPISLSTNKKSVFRIRLNYEINKSSIAIWKQSRFSIDGSRPEEFSKWKGQRAKSTLAICRRVSSRDEQIPSVCRPSMTGYVEVFAHRNA